MYDGSMLSGYTLPSTLAVRYRVPPDSACVGIEGPRAVWEVSTLYGTLDLYIPLTDLYGPPYGPIGPPYGPIGPPTLYTAHGTLYGTLWHPVRYPMAPWHRRPRYPGIDVHGTMASIPVNVVLDDDRVVDSLMALRPERPRSLTFRHAASRTGHRGVQDGDRGVQDG